MAALVQYQQRRPGRVPRCVARAESVRHAPRGWFICRRLAVDPVTALRTRRLRRQKLEALDAALSWLRWRTRIRCHGRRPQMIRRCAASEAEQIVRSERLYTRKGRPRHSVRVRWVVADVGAPDPNDDALPPAKPARISPILRVRQRRLLAEALSGGPATPMTAPDWDELDAIADDK